MPNYTGKQIHHWFQRDVSKDGQNNRILVLIMDDAAILKIFLTME
jgi:hypothetical protein